MTSHRLVVRVILRRFKKRLDDGSAERVYPGVGALGAATVARRTLLGVVQAGAGGAAQLAGASKDAQFARGESIKREA